MKIARYARFGTHRQTEHGASALVEKGRPILYDISVRQQTPEDDNTAFLARNILGIIDEINSRNISKQVARGLRTNAEMGFFNGGTTPYGYTTISTEIPARSGFKKKLTIDAGEAEIVRLIFRLAEEGVNGMPMRTGQIAQYLNKHSSLRRGKLWRKQAVDNVLQNEAYAETFGTCKTKPKTGKLRPRDE